MEIKNTLQQRLRFLVASPLNIGPNLDVLVIKHQLQKIESEILTVQLTLDLRRKLERRAAEERERNGGGQESSVSEIARRAIERSVENDPE
jgi:hypothetical protein